jgi:hypothetical protein
VRDVASADFAHGEHPGHREHEVAPGRGRP